MMSIKKGLVSVVIITYNQEDFIFDAMMSVINQSYDNFEVIVADDGSTDGTQEIINELANQYPDIVVPAIGYKNEGIAANANRGLKLAKGEYVAWLGGDDLMLSEKLSKQVKLLTGHIDAVGCVHEADVFQSESGESLGLFSVWANGRKGLKDGGVELWFEHGYMMLPSTMMFRREFAPKHGLDVRLKYTNDWLFDVELFRQGKVLAINEVLGRYRRHGANVTGSQTLNEVAVEDNLMAVAIIEARFPELSKLLRKKRQIILLGASRSLWGIDKKKSLSFMRAAYYAGGMLNLIGIIFSWGFRAVLKKVKS